MVDSSTFFVIWLTFTIIVFLSIIPFVVWAKKTGHFSNFEHAKRLPLTSHIVEDEQKPVGSKNNVSA